MKFAVQIGHDIKHDHELQAILSCNHDILFFRNASEVPSDIIPVGNLSWCEQFLTYEQLRPDYFPSFTTDYLYRKIWTTDKWPMEPNIFIKPADRHKRFESFITIGGYKHKKRGPFICSEVVPFDSEFRYYIAAGRIFTTGCFGDNTTIPELPCQVPANYYGALDFGFLKTGEYAIIESNSPYSVGWYGSGSDNCLYVDWLIKSWNYLKNQ
jgi:hypothetical protein